MTDESPRPVASRESLIARWEAMWSAEDPHFDVTQLRDDAARLDTDTLSFLAPSSERRLRMQLTSSEFEFRFGAHAGRALALALRDPEVARLVAWSVCQSHDPAAFDAFVSLLKCRGAAWSAGSESSLATYAVRVFERRETFAAWRDEPPCTTSAVRLPVSARAQLVDLLDHPVLEIREAVADALAYAFEPRIEEESAPIYDALMARVLDPAVGPFAYRVFARTPKRSLESSLRELATREGSWWLLACVARLGDMELVRARFDGLAPGDQCGVAEAVMGRAKENRAFLIERLRDESSSLQLRETIFTLFGENDRSAEVRRYEPLLVAARQREADRRAAEARTARAPEVSESDFRVFEHPSQGRWSIARASTIVHIRITSTDGEVTPRVRTFGTFREAESYVSGLVSEQLADGYVEVHR